MDVLKYKVLDNDGFIEWQIQKDRKIQQIMPVVSGMEGNMGESGAVSMIPCVNVFVLYWESADSALEE